MVLKKSLFFVFRSVTNLKDLKTGMDAAITAAIFEQDVSIIVLDRAVSLFENINSTIPGSQNSDFQQILDTVMSSSKFGISQFIIDSSSLTSISSNIFIDNHYFKLMPIEKIRHLVHNANIIVNF